MYRIIKTQYWPIDLKSKVYNANYDLQVLNKEIKKKKKRCQYKS